MLAREIARNVYLARRLRHSDKSRSTDKFNFRSHVGGRIDLVTDIMLR